MARLDPAGGNPKRKRKPPSRGPKQVASGGRKPTVKSPADRASSAVQLGRLERTRRLILAALRVWELKRKIHE